MEARGSSSRTRAAVHLEIGPSRIRQVQAASRNSSTYLAANGDTRRFGRDSAKMSAREADEERAVVTGKTGRSSSLETHAMSEDIELSTAVQDSSEDRAFRDRDILPT